MLSNRIDYPPQSGRALFFVPNVLTASLGMAWHLILRRWRQFEGVRNDSVHRRPFSNLPRQAVRSGFRHVATLPDIMHCHPSIQAAEIIIGAGVNAVVREIAREECFLAREFALSIRAVNGCDIARQVSSVYREGERSESTSAEHRGIKRVEQCVIDTLGDCARDILG